MGGWTITVPLQMIEFYLILSAVSNKITQGSFWKLLIGTVVMLVFGYTGEAHLCPGGAWVGFAGGMCGWFFILFEIFGGEAGSVAGELGSANKFTQASFGTMRLIVTAGWTSSTTLQISSTRSPSALPSGRLPRTKAFPEHEVIPWMELIEPRLACFFGA